MKPNPFYEPRLSSIGYGVWIALEENVNKNNFLSHLIQGSKNITDVDHSPHQSSSIHVPSGFWKGYQTNM